MSEDTAATTATEQAATDTPAAATAEPKKGSPIRASGLALVLADGTELKPIKYPMPIKAPKIDITVNGTDQKAAQTTFKDIKYTYFTFGEASFYVPGHLDLSQDFKLKYNEGYSFSATKMDRKATSEKAAAALKAKKASGEPAGAEGASQNPDAGGASADAGAAQTEAGGSPPPSGEAAAAPVQPEAAVQKKGKKASR